MARRLRRPSWRDRRLVLGAVLVLASTVLGARLLGTSDGGVDVWAARHNLAAGVPLRSGDLVPRHVRLEAEAARYVAVDGAVPDGVVLARAVGSGELLPVGAIASSSGAPLSDVRSVTVPVDRFHVADDLARGERVDVYVTPHGDTATSGPVAARLLVSDAVVLDIDQDEGRFGGTGAARGVVVSVPARSVGTLVAGLDGGTVDVVRVPSARP